MDRSLVSESRGALVLGHLLFACLVIAGCAVLGKESMREGQLRRAILEDQLFTVEQVPEDAPPHRAASFRLAAEGYRAIREGQLQDAEDNLEKALSLDPRNPFSYFYLADIRFREGEIDQALILLSQAEVLFQGHPYWLGEVYTQKGQYWEMLDSFEKARSAYSRALEYNPWNEESRKKIGERGASEG